MISTYILHTMEWFGTISFAISGTLVAISHGLDLFGIIIVGCITAVGGGIIRDTLLGSFPPKVFYHHTMLLVAMVTSLLVFMAAYINSKRFIGVKDRLEYVNNVFDAIGLGAFSVMGVEIACTAGYTNEILLTLTMGVLSGVGGGVLRDVLVNEKPYIFTKHIYALASIAGSCIYYFTAVYTPYKVAGPFVAVSVTIIIRLLAAKYRWKLPKVHFPEDK